MGIVRTPATIERGLRAEFQRMMAISELPNPQLEGIMLTVNSTTRDEKYAWFEDLGQLKEVKDSIEINSIFDSTFTVANRTYAKAFAITRSDLEDDQVGGAIQRIGTLTMKARLFPQKLLLDAIIAGTTDTGYDGQPFYSITHETGNSGVQSNLLTGTGVTLAALKDDFDSAIEAMMRFKNAEGEPIVETDVNFKPLVVAPSSLWGSFRDLQNAAIINNTENLVPSGAIH